MRTSVTIVACTLPDWHALVRKCTDIYKSSPTRELDKKSIPVGDTSSYAMVLEVINNRAEAVGNLSKAYRSLDFIHVTFLIYFEDGDQVQSFCNLLNVVHIQYADREGNVLLCGSLRQLRDLIEGVRLVVQDRIDLRTVFEGIESRLGQLGFKEIF